MGYKRVEIKNTVGLHKQANSLMVPDGALEQATNTITRNDGRIDRRRGFYEVLDPAPAVPNRLIEYEEQLMMVTEDDGIAHLTETGTAPNKTMTAAYNAGEAFTVTAGRISRFAEANKNLYLTADQGVMKLEAYDGSVYKSGIPPALDLRGAFTATNGPIASGSEASPVEGNQVAWRLVFGRRDSNDNLTLGVPSDILVLTNTIFAEAAYTNPSGNIVEITTLIAHNLIEGMTINVANADDTGINGLYVITLVGVGTPATQLRITKGSAVSPATGVLDFGASRATRIEFSVPNEINSGEHSFYQLYRSSQSGDQDIVPFADFKLIVERELTSTEISTGVGFYDDQIPDLLLGAELYTNENSRDGELQANDRAPLAADITLYKGHMIYGNVRSRHQFYFNVVTPSNLTDGQYIEIRVGLVVRRYYARAGVGNNTTRATAVSGTTTITVTYNAHGLVNGDIVRVSRITGSLPEGEYTVSAAAANTFAITSTGNSATALDFQGVRNSLGYDIFYRNTASPATALALRESAQALVKAINRDGSGVVYARYVSGISGVPGQIFIQAQGFTDEIEFRASTTTIGGVFEPVFPTAFGTLQSDNDELPHVIFVSKAFEPEAVPLANFFEVGARNEVLLRCIALQDSLILIKRDAVFRLTGDSVASMSITPIDTTLEAINASTAEAINNQISFLSNQGFALITENAVQLTSRKIEDVIQPLVAQPNANTVGAAVAYESERLYLVSTLEPGQDDLSITYCYNVLNDTWTDWDLLFKQGTVGPRDTLYLISTSDKILRERKLFTRLDYSDQNYPLTVTSVATDLASATINVAAVPEPGDVIVKNDVISRIRSVTALGGGNYSVGFEAASNLVIADSLQLYDAYQVTCRWAPFHAGEVGVMKRFAEVQIHFRTHRISHCTLNFGGAYQNASINTEWYAMRVTGTSGTGWGSEPWGSFPWGDVDSIALKYGTQATPIVRTWVPLQISRNPYIQMTFVHNEAAEPFELQAIVWSMTAYNQRVSK